MNCADCGKCDLFGDLLLNQLGAIQKHQSVLEILRITGILRLSVGRLIHDLFRATQAEDNNVLYSVANVLSGRAATHPAGKRLPVVVRCQYICNLEIAA